MPDLQTALTKVINEWEKPAPTNPPAKGHRFQPSNNVSRATFDFIKTNPGMARSSVIKQLTSKGYKVSSVTSLITQMLRQGMVKVSNGGVFVTQPDYRPLRPSVIKAERTKRRAKKSEAASAPMPIEQPDPIIKSAWSAHEALKGLSVIQAHELFVELRKIFRD